MRDYLLHPSEWHRLSALDDCAWRDIWRQLRPHVDQVLVVERDGAIVAATMLVPIWHLEGTWIAPELRGHVSIGRRFLRFIGAVLKQQHIAHVWTMARTPETAALCAKLGPSTHLACDHFSVNVEGLWA